MRNYIKTIMILLLTMLLFFSASIHGYASVPVVASVSIGDFHGLALKDDGTVWAWGAPYPGSDLSYFGAGQKDNGSILIKIDGLTNVTAISAGSSHSLALKDDGTVWAWGFNLDGQLGDGTYNNSNIPVRVKNLNNITAISAGARYNLALNKDGTLWAWGDNHEGQLGDGTINKVEPYGKNTPVKVDISNVKAISAGGFSAVIKDDGSVWAWGNNEFSQIGHGLNPIIPYPTMVSGISNVKQIAVGRNHILAIKNDGTIWEWGDVWNEFSKSTIVSTPRQLHNFSQMVDISAGWVHSMALKDDGTVYTWGSNSDGQLGGGSDTSYVKAEPVKITSLVNISNIDAGSFNSVALTYDGAIWEWGRNIEGQINPDSIGTKIATPHNILKGIPSETQPINKPKSNSNAPLDKTGLNDICVIGILILVVTAFGLISYIYIRNIRK